MIARLRRIAALFILLAASAAAQVCIDGVTTLTVATVEQARAVLSKVDISLENKSAWECGAQMGKVAQVDAQTYANYTASCALEWTAAERAAILQTFRELAEPLKPYAHYFPPIVYVIKTDGREEYGGAYTRQNAVIIERPPAPPGGFGGRRGARGANAATSTTGATARRGRGSARGDGATSATRGRRGGRGGRGGGGGVPAGLLAHELWHVLSRNRVEARNRVYQALGYEYCGPLEWPAALERLRITNPDAPINQHWIDVTYHGQPYHVMPIIYARTERFGIDVNGSLGGFMTERMLAVEKAPDGKGVVAVMRDGRPLEMIADDLQGFWEKVGAQHALHDPPRRNRGGQFRGDHRRTHGHAFAGGDREDQGGAAGEKVMPDRASAWQREGLCHRTSKIIWAGPSSSRRSAVRWWGRCLRWSCSVNR